jgi:hypothetical protein
MVPAVNALRASFDQLSKASIKARDYGGDLSDVVFDMLSAESFVAGVADRLLSGQQMLFEHRSVITDDLLRGNAWISQSRAPFDLTPYPEVLEYARTIDETRKACLRVSSQ